MAIEWERIAPASRRRFLLASLAGRTARPGRAASASAMPAALRAAGRYFATPGGEPVYLAGSHSWTNQQDHGGRPFAFDKYLDLLARHRMNFIRLWVWETPDWTPTIYERQDRRFDLTRLNPAYFGRLRSRVEAAGARGLYVSIMLFQGWSLVSKNGKDDPWPSHPFNAANNINGVNGDPDGKGHGLRVTTLADPRITALQAAYVARVLDTVAGLPNVLFEIGNELAGDDATFAWQNAMVETLHRHQAHTGGLRHPVGMTAPWPVASATVVNARLLASRADWISPSGGHSGYRDDPPVTIGRKVVLLDSDHVFGVGGDGAWVWRSFTRGYNLLYMDDLAGMGIAGALPNDGRNAAFEASARAAMAQTRHIATLVGMTDIRPSASLSSTRFALWASSGRCIIYAPGGGSFVVDLAGHGRAPAEARWMDLRSGALSPRFAVPRLVRWPAFTPPYEAAALIVVPRA